MASVEDNNVLLKLVVKGMDPAEVKRLAEQTYGQLKADAAQHIEKLVSFHRQKQHEMDEDVKKRIDEQIKAETKALDSVQKLMRQQEIAANAARNAWGRALEHMENVTVVAQGAWAAISGGAAKFKAVGDEIDRLTNIYGSLKGSIDEMREATAGEVADIDLITTKNRAFAKDLQLTDQQFGMVAAAADSFADSLGTNTKEALDQIIDGLATGRTKMLESAGIVIDSTKAQEDYARSIGTVADKLSETGKKTAIAQAALRAMDMGVAESGGTVKNFAHEWETTMAKLQNIHDKVFLAIGQQVVTFLRYWTVEVPHGIEIAIAKIKDVLPGQEGNAQAAIESYLRDRDAANAADTRQAEAAAKRLAGDQGAYKINTSESPRGSATKSGNGRAEKRGPTLEEMAAKARGGYLLPELADAGQPEEDVTEILAAKAIKAQPGDLEAWIAQQEEAVTKAEEMGARLNAVREEALAETEQRAGFLSTFLFGPDGPEQTYEQMDEAMQKTVDNFGVMSGMLSGAGKKMGDALAKNLTAVISGNAAMRVSMKQVTHDVMESLSQQALVKAIYSTAEGLALLASYQYPAAASAFAAAAAFGAVGVAAGLGARAIGSPSAGAGTASMPKTDGMSTGQPSSFSSGPRSSGSDEDEQKTQSITVNMTVMPGGEAEAGRSIMRAIAAAEASDGPAYGRHM